MFQNLKIRVHSLGQGIYAWLFTWTHGRISIPVSAVQRFGQTSGTVVASSLAFYAVFSLFPLLGVLVSLASYFVPENRIHALLLEALVAIIPVSADLISRNVDRFIELRGTISLVGTLELIWSASSAFTILLRQIDLAWEHSRARSSFHRRIIAVGMLAVIILSFAVLWILTGLVDLVVTLKVPVVTDPHVYNSVVWKVFPLAASTLIGFLIFFMLYRWVPNHPVNSGEAAWGAFVVTVLWSLTSLLFKWYVSSRLASYNLLYGSLTALTVLMLWFYLNSLILLFGAHLCASISGWRLIHAEDIGD
ncbi:MAG: YihY/virulence factor BrkB family protein [Anaerolineaceae bacterium]|nr:YihY/virulence factor BrkB family protein [Anaerolineaceae bacterium]